MDSLRDALPGLRALPKQNLGVGESPVQRLTLGGVELWVKRDDLNAPVLGGNKVRALEYLLPSTPSSKLLTVGGIGSTHVLATAYHARTCGIETVAYRWQHFLNPIGELTSRAIAAMCSAAPVWDSAFVALTRAAGRRVTGQETWIPFGATSPRGILGHIGGGLELAQQIRRGDLPAPKRVFCPLGTGGTAAGIALGLALGGCQVPVVAVRAGPRLGVEALRIAHLIRRTKSLLRREGAALPDVHVPIAIDHSAFGEGYAHPHPEARALSNAATGLGITLDDTYSAKACLAAVRWARNANEPCLLWHTYDGRWWSDPTFFVRPS